MQSLLAIVAVYYNTHRLNGSARFPARVLRTSPHFRSRFPSFGGSADVSGIGEKAAEKSVQSSLLFFWHDRLWGSATRVQLWCAISGAHASQGES